MFGFLKIVGLLKVVMFYYLIFILLCQLGAKGGRKGSSTIVMCLCFKAKGQLLYLVLCQLDTR